MLARWKHVFRAVGAKDGHCAGKRAVHPLGGRKSQESSSRSTLRGMRRRPTVHGPWAIRAMAFGSPRETFVSADRGKGIERTAPGEGSNKGAESAFRPGLGGPGRYWRLTGRRDK